MRDRKGEERWKKGREQSKRREATYISITAKNRRTLQKGRDSSSGGILRNRGP